MRRKAPGRSAGLTARMTIALVSIAGTLAAAAAGLISLFFVLPSWWPLWTLVIGGLAFTTAREYLRAEQALLDVAHAKVVEAGEAPHIHRHVERLSAMFDIPLPRIAIAGGEIPSGFVVGTRRRRAIITVSHDLRVKLDADELEAVLAHELAHVAHRDAAVMTVASLPRTIGLQLFAAENWILLWFFLWPFGFLLYAWGSLLTRTISRYREYEADAAAALVVGRADSLMSAIEKLAGEAERIPDRDLRQIEALNPFFMVARRRPAIELFSDHPPVEKRLARLATIAREMGRPD
jgi:heat shock protein HtpX